MRSSRRTFFRTIVIVVLAASFVIASYIFGAVSANNQIWPFPLLHEMRANLHPYRRANGEVEDSYHRLVAYRGKQEAPCPAQSDKTMVLLIIGQSNAANSGGQRQPPRDGVVNYFDGKCYAASSPLLGTTGNEGEIWTLLGGKLIASGAYDRVILVASAMSGTNIAQWEDKAELNLMLQSVLSKVVQQYHITNILWQQGENDVGVLTKEQYEQKFMSLVDSIRRLRVDAPIYVAVSTRCEITDFPWTPDNPIAEALRSLPKPEAGILPGVDTDSLVQGFDRLDDCHFGASGEEKAAAAWVGILTRP